MILLIGAAALLIVAVGGLFYRSYACLPFAAGALLASGWNALKVVMLERTVNKALDMEDPRAGKNYARAQHLLRYLITALVLAAAAVAPDRFISLWGAAAGIFTFQAAAVAIKLLKLDRGLENAPLTTAGAVNENGD